MNVDVTMPQLGETVAEGTVTRWLRQVGEAVGDQEPLVEIATDKVDTEVPSPAAGTLLEIRVPADSTVAVGTVIAVIGEPNGSVAPPPPPTASHGDRCRSVHRAASEHAVARNDRAGPQAHGIVIRR